MTVRAFASTAPAWQGPLGCDLTFSCLNHKKIVLWLFVLFFLKHFGALWGQGLCHVGSVVQHDLTFMLAGTPIVACPNPLGSPVERRACP